MCNKWTLVLVVAYLPSFALAQADRGGAEATEQPDEVIVTGRRDLMALRIQMMDAERAAYEAFNQFNDDDRFDIFCNMHQRTGTRLENQVCEPEFEIQARRSHARDFAENYRDYINQWVIGNPNPTENAMPSSVPMEAMIASQRKDYQRKMRQVAEAHPEFLDALKDYAEVRQQYEQATSTAAK